MRLIYGLGMRLIYSLGTPSTSYTALGFPWGVKEGSILFLVSEVSCVAVVEVTVNAVCSK